MLGIVEKHAKEAGLELKSFEEAAFGKVRNNEESNMDIIFDSRPEAQYVVENIMSILEGYGVVTVGEIYGLAEMDVTYNDHMYGYRELDLTVKRTKVGYSIQFPPAIDFKKEKK